MQPFHLNPRSYRSESGKNAGFTPDRRGYKWGSMRN